MMLGTSNVERQRKFENSACCPWGCFLLAYRAVGHRPTKKEKNRVEDS
jgi:hypothetical protein